MKTLIVLALMCAVVVPAHAQQAGWLGVTIEDGQNQGASVRSVEADSPAAKAGLKSGDLIVEYNKTPVLGSMQLTRLIRETPAGRTVDVRYLRDGSEQTAQVTTGSAPAMRLFSSNGRFGDSIIDLRNLADQYRFNMPRLQVSMSYSRAGIRTDEMTSQLREFFGVRDDSGVLVASVDPESAAGKGGLKAGDVITAVDNQSVRTPSDFDRELRQGSGKISLHIVRDKKELDLSFERPDTLK